MPRESCGKGGTRGDQSSLRNRTGDSYRSQWDLTFTDDSIWSVNTEGEAR